MSQNFSQRYGPWALIAGASEGLGAAFARALAARGMNLVLLARRAALLDELARSLEAAHGVRVRAVACDLASPDLAARLRDETADLEVGVAVYNAAYSSLGALLDRPLDDALRVVDVNVRGPLQLVHALAPAMVARRRGAVVLMSSLAGVAGSPRLAAYAASKAFTTVLGQSLWAELRPHGVDVAVCCAGATRTPNYLATTRVEAPGTLDAEVVAERALAQLGRGPLVVPGAVNKLAAALLGRLLPRGAAVAMMDRSTRSLERAT